MLFSKIGIIDENFNYKADMYVGIEGDRITYVDVIKPNDISIYGEVYDGKGKLLMPAFYNAHGHSPMSLMRGYGENLPLQSWLEEKIFPFEEKLYSKAVFWGTLLSMAESIRFGIVSTSDMYFFIDDMVRAISVSGIKSNISRSVTNPLGAALHDCVGFTEMREAIKMYDGFEDGRIRVEASPHAEYTNDEKTIRAIADTAKEFKVGVHVHVAETQKETEECLARHKKTPIEFFNHCGLLDSRTNAAHCVWLTAKDREIIKAKGVSVSSNPISNLKLTSGICDVPKLYEKNINVAIGTDSSASNNSLNMFEEMKTFALLGKIKSDNPASMTPNQVIRSATRSGALAQGREDCGLISKGFKADLIVVDTTGPNMRPVHNIMNNLVYSADGKDVCLTMCDGKVLYEDGEYKTLDIEKIVFETEKAKNKILGSI